MGAREVCRGEQRFHGESCHQLRPSRPADGPEDLGKEKLGGFGERCHQALVHCAIRTQSCGGPGDVALEQDRTLIQHVCHRCRRMDPVETEALEGSGPEERRDRRHRMGRRAHVVEEARQSERFGSDAAAHGRSRLADQNRQPGLRQRQRRRQSVRARAHHHRIVLVQATLPGID